MQIGFLGLLGLILVVLKLVGTISWSWWLILLPFYGGFMLWFIFILTVGWMVSR